MNEVIDLNEEQRKAVSHEKGPLLIIAGAGTGKTTVVTQRIKHLIIEKEIDPSRILALTFTEKAAQEMEERVDVALPYGYTQLWISTFHSFCDRILRQDAIHIGLNPSFKLSTEAESMLFLKKNLFKLNLVYFRPLGNPYKFLQGLIQHFNRLKDDDITPEDYCEFADKLAKDTTEDPQEIKKIQELAYSYKTYEELKAKESIMDFSDLNANVLKLFRERSNILSYYQKQFEYVLVDEFQDTNFAQNELAMMLAGKKANINVVGDDDQSIYRWRGAAIANIIHFRKRYPQAEIVTLTQNYRSSDEILDTAYTLIQNNNPDRLEVKEHISKKLKAMRINSAISSEKQDLKHQPDNFIKNNVKFLYANRVENEAEMVKDEIKKLVKERGLAYKDIAILVRANDHSQPFARALERARIPYQFLGPGHLFHQEEIKDLIAYLQILYNFENNAALYRVLSMPIFNLEARDIAALLIAAKKQNKCLFEICENADAFYLKEETKTAVKRITEMIKKHLISVPRETAGQILYYFLEDSGMLQQYLGAQLPHEEKRAQNIAKFFERLKGFEASHPDASVFSVVDWIDLAMQLGESPMAADMDWTDNNAVNILTVHSSKGLEFPAVFIVSLVSQRFPSKDRKEQIPVPEKLIKEQLPEGNYNLQEERRLFYVGITRAKDYLYLSAAKYYGEGKRERKLSPFITEALGEHSVNEIIRKQKDSEYVQQLSLLDFANEKVKQETNSLLNNEAIQKVIVNQAINYISYSQLQTFDYCPLHYKLKYILKIPSDVTAAQSFGMSIHAALRDYYSRLMKGENGDKISINTLLQNNWIQLGYENKEHADFAFKQAENILTNFLNKKDNIKAIPLGLEIPFSFYINDLKVSGRIDRVDQLPNNIIEIIDYKTGYQMPTEKQIGDDLQLSLYALAAAEVRDKIFNRKPDQVVLSLWYVENDIKISTTRTEEQLSIIKQQVLEKVDLISKSTFNCSGGIFCKNCEYKMLCQTFSS